MSRGNIENTKFGSPYAVINLSKIGMRYFRLFIKLSPSSKKILIDNFINHPNVGWIFSAKGWFNLGIGLWAKDNAEIIDISSAIRNILTKKDEIVYQSELTTLYGFGNRPVTGEGKEMQIVDAVAQPNELDHLSIDYLKLLTIDSSLSKKEFSEIIGVNQDEIDRLNHEFQLKGIVVGHQERINYSGRYFKVFIDTTSRKTDRSVDELIRKLWSDNHSIYFERANGKYDLEFEIILNNKSDLNQYLRQFSVFKVAELTENLYTNLFPLNKTANLKEIRDTIFGQEGTVIDLRNSKLWYLNYEGVNAYINIYENKKYMETMEMSEIVLFDDIISYINNLYPGQTFNIIDLGSGDGLKGKIFIEKIGEKNVKAYYPVDIQPIELASVLNVHKDGEYALHPTLLGFENLSSRFPLNALPGEKQIYIFLGGTWGNYQNEQINSYIKGLVNENSIVIITMPIVAESKTKSEIIDSYANMNFENIAFGPLMQVGFKKSDFILNSGDKNLIVQIDIEDDRLVSSLILKNEVSLLGRIFPRGTVFKMTTSWKPTVEEFQKALEFDFKVEKMFTNKDMAIAIIAKKP